MRVSLTILLTICCAVTYAQDTTHHPPDSMKVRDLNETVVIGYGVVKKRDLTGAVYTIKKDVIMQAPVANPLESLQGRVPGMDITRSSGAPGAGADVLIRGTRSIAGGNGPLYIIDGLQGGSMSYLNPSDIESVEVLKDASATAIYGSQGANGVVIITTKKGKPGKTKVSYNGYYGANGYTQYPAPRMGESYLQLRREAWRASLNPGETLPDDATIFANQGEYDAIQKGQWVNWVDLLMHNSTQQSHSVSVSGGTDKTKAFMSFGYYRENGALKYTNLTRYSVRLNLDQEISRFAKAGIQSQINYTSLNKRKDPMSVALSTTPLGVPYDAYGNVNVYPVAGNTNTISPLTDDRGPEVATDQTIGATVFMNGYLDVTPVKGLTFRSNFGTFLSFNRDGIFQAATSLNRAGDATSYTSITNGNTRFYNWDNVLTYNLNKGDHAITITALSSYTHKDADTSSASGVKQVLGTQLFYNLDATEATSRKLQSTYKGSATMSYAARINYSYKGRYLFQFSERMDGASRLAVGHKWAGFPSVSAGWRLSDEPFMRNARNLDDLKLRVTYGVAGNSAISEYGTQSGLTQANNISFGEVPASGYVFNSTIGNTNLGWELSATTNVGLDMSFLNSRINASIDAYNTKTTKLLLLRTLPVSTGVSYVYQNIGSTNNKGIEIALNTVNIAHKHFKWTSTITFTTNRERINSLVGNKDIIDKETNSLLLGHPVHSFYTYQKLGIWQTNEADKAAALTMGGTAFKPGSIKLADVNRDSVINNADRKYLGSPVPKWSIGWQHTFNYRAFDLGIFVVARWGQMIYGEFLGRYNAGGENGGPAFVNYWTPENPTNDYPRPKKSTKFSDYAGYQSMLYIDGSYFKVKNITLGYTLPHAVSSRLSIDNLRVYATAANIFTKARSHLLKYYDPERGGAESSPLSKQVVVGLNVDF
ncbi:SusC/RagA family TonB-linked outer membrane protein [[Flexibacter] sp. ATCC 35208]|uniref:SusC/RagA family TonB-linked outer membrane protein n=1 Tax=[Flexibacter] sp. ATCC 35208 TaxID=1936242 RepID=UPI0009D61E63|nr:SusC/RagA family TonB-linked outer membrane protein [[Flexibacter] sp. ATCC 35208]OMP80363.1 hypothetical protein BW716_04365 [[Flexibacter] sp. ATCC 35208]